MVYKYSFKHFMDISTSAESVQIIKIKAGGEYVHQRCKHLFGVFKYFKLGAVKVKLVPASTLPVDPLGLSYGDTDPQTVDPRDQMNPGLVRITNGESIFDRLTGISGDEQMQMYLNTMLDPRWSKFMLQRGFKRTAVPLAYEVGNLKQTVYPDAIRNLPVVQDSLTPGVHPKIVGTSNNWKYVDDSTGDVQEVTFPHDSSGRGLFQLGHHKRIGWLSVDNYERMVAGSSEKGGFNSFEITPVPSVDCITVILPKAFKTKFYYRMFITETVYFDGVKNVGNFAEIDGSPYEFRSFDNFMVVRNPEPASPNLHVIKEDMITEPNDGST